MCNIKITLQPNDVKSDDLERDKLKADFATISNQLQHDLDITVTLVEEQRNAMYNNPRAYIARYALGPVEVILQSTDWSSYPHADSICEVTTLIVLWLMLLQIHQQGVDDVMTSLLGTCCRL